MNCKGLFPLVLALVAATGTQAVAQTAERPALSWTFKEGDNLYYAFSWKFRNSRDVQGQSLNDIKINVRYTLTQKVTAVTDGKASIDATITSVRAVVEPKMMGMPMPAMEFDSAAPEAANPLLKMIRHVVDKKFSFKLSTTGAVTDVTGGDKIRETVIAVAKDEVTKAVEDMGQGGGGGGMGGMAGMMDPAMIGQILAQQLTVAFANETLQTTLDIVNNVLPSEAKAQGETWTRDIEETLPRLGSLKFKGKYTHGGTVNGNTRITFEPEGEATLEKAEKSGEDDPMSQMMQAEQEVKSTSTKGSATFSGGKLIDSEVIQEIKAISDLPPMLQMQMGGNADAKLDIGYFLTLRYEKQDGPVGGAKGDEKDKGASF